MDAQSIIVTCVIGYLMGTIQPAYLIGKLKGIDIREHGSKNAGAANTSMTLGWGLGFLTALLDILKAAAAVHLVRCFLTSEPFNLITPESFTFLPFLGGAMAVLGHNYPFYMKFKGGKGTACAMGLMFGFDPLWGLIMIATLMLQAFCNAHPHAVPTRLAYRGLRPLIANSDFQVAGRREEAGRAALWAFNEHGPAHEAEIHYQENG